MVIRGISVEWVGLATSRPWPRLAQSYQPETVSNGSAKPYPIVRGYEQQRARRFRDRCLAATHPDIAPGECVTFAVRHTGTGMWPDADQRAFEPFFAIKELGARRDDDGHDVRRLIARYVIAVTSGRATLEI